MLVPLQLVYSIDLFLWHSDLWILYLTDYIELAGQIILIWLNRHLIDSIKIFSIVSQFATRRTVIFILINSLCA